MSVGSNAPVIIKRKKVVSGDGHHGGAWKVAYADFVTAMMAFFMLMWLLNATTEKQRKGIADYFSPTIPINRVSGGGDGSFGGDSVFTEDTLAQNGIGATSLRAAPQKAGSVGFKDGDKLRELEQILLGSGGEVLASENALRHFVTRVTDEGLVVELFALEGEPLFVPGSDTPTVLLIELVSVVARVFALATNSVAIEGHSRSHAVVLKQNPVWDRSVERAEIVREMMIETLTPERIDRIVGHADRKPAVSNPMAMRNDRLEVVLLRSDV